MYGLVKVKFKLRNLQQHNVPHWTNFQKNYRNIYKRLDCISIITPSWEKAKHSE
jgi:hypothetical protein